MKKLSILLIVILAVSFSSCRSTDKRILKNEADSLAYVIGMNVGYNLKYNTDSTLNVEALCAAIRDIYADKTLMDMDEAGAFYRQYYNVVKPRRAREASQRFLEETLRDTPSARKTDSGLIYVIEEPGDTVRARQLSDRIRIKYRGTTKDGREIESTAADGEVAEFALNEVIKGLREGVGLIGNGGRIKLWIPSELAYGSTGNRKVGANEALCFEVELVEVIPSPESAENSQE